MMSSQAALFSRSTADWASSGSAITASHSLGSRFEVSTVARGVVPLDAELVDVGRLRGVERLEGEVVDDEEIDTDELAHLGIVAGVETRRLQSLVQLVGPLEVHADAPAAGDVAEGGGHEGLAHADRSEDEGVAGLLDEAHRDELGPHPGRR